MAAKKDAPLTISIPTPKEDRAITSKVGLIAAIGFGIGVVWPRLVGLHIGPNPPESASSGRTQQVASPKASGSAAVAPSASDDAAEPPKVTNKETVIVSPGEITSCWNKKGERISECGALSLDKVTESKLKAVGDCAFAIGIESELSFALSVNFEKSLIDVTEGKKKGAGLTNMTRNGLLKCAADELKGVELDKVPHTHPRYIVDYKLAFYPPGKSPDDSKTTDTDATEPGENPSLGRATVVFPKAIVRAKPDGQASVITRIPKGTHVKILKQEKDWYEIKSSGTQGWVHRQALGK